ncbi:MAG: hypothetical protein GY724_03730 [Actinomycetia bacterium]|nr:hypothetical protein [Actinomycetes bacterium]
MMLTLAAALVGLSATPAAAETKIEVTTPADGRYEPGQPTPLIVTISADQAISGTLSATFEGFLAGSKEVEVPGGSTKEIVFIVTAPPWVSSGSVRFDADDEDADATERIALTVNQNDELVGVFGELTTRNLPATAELSVEIGQARLYPFESLLLDVGPDALSTFGQIIITPNDLETMDSTQVDTLESWVASKGGTLVIDGEPGADLPIKASTSIDGSASSQFGMGAILYSNGQALAGNYDGLLKPTASQSSDQFPWSGGFGGAPTTPALARDAGISIPPIGSLVLVLLVYMVAAGPVLWFGLKRSKREPILWLALPALALVATLGVYLFGRTLRDNTNAAHATIVADLPSIREISTQVLVTSANGGTEGVRLDDGWRATTTFSEAEFFGEGPFGRTQRTATPRVSGSDLVADLPPGGVGVVAAEATMPLTSDPAWLVDLVEDDGSLTGTVTNLTSHELEEVLVASGQGFQRIGSIGPGESAEVTLRDANVPPMGNDPLIERMWANDPWNSDDSAVNPGILMQWLAGRPILRTPGFVLVLGWTKEEPGPVLTTRGAVIDSGRTAFVSANRLQPDVLTNQDYQLELLRGLNTRQITDVAGNACAEFPLVLRLKTSEAVQTNPVLDLSRRSIAAMDVWDGSEWLAAGVQQAPNDRVILDVPPSALDDNELYMRVMMGCEFWQQANPFPDLRPATADDEILRFGSPGDEKAEEEGEADA